MANRRNTVVRLNTLPFPIAAPSDFSEGAFCIKISPHWTAYLMGLTPVLKVRSLWEHTTEQEWQQLNLWVDELAAMVNECVTEPTPPTEPEPPTPEQPVERGSAGTSAVGSLGYTIEELEEMLLMAITKIEWRGDELWFRDGCCDWYKVGQGIAGAIANPVNPTTSALEQGVSYLLGNAAATLPLLPAPPAPPLHTSADSVKCAKATAMQDGFYIVMDDLSDLLDAVTLGNITTSVILEFAAATLLTGGWAAAALLATALSYWATQDKIDDSITEIAAQYADTDKRAEIICELVDRLDEGTQVTADDIRHFFEVWESVTAPSDTLKSLMEIPPSVVYRNVTQELVEGTPCGCDAYKPYGYEPPLASGVVATFKQMVFTSSGGNTNTQNVDNLPYEAYQQTPAHGTKTGTNSFKSAFVGLASPYYYHGCGILVEFQPNTTLQQIKFEEAISSGAWQDSNVEAYVYRTTDNLWHDINAGNIPGASGTVTQNLGTLTQAKYAVIWVKGAMPNNSTFFTLSDIRFTGTLNDVPFLELPLGQPIS